MRFLTCVALLLAASSVQAYTITVTPTQDLRYFETGGSDNGALSIYTDGEGQTPGSNVQRSVMQFNLASIPSNAVIESAVLTLTHDSAIYHTGQPAGTQANLFALTESWNTNATWTSRDGTTNWTTAGGTTTGSTFATNNTTIADNSGVVLVPFDVKTLVQQWTSGALTNDGVLLTGTEGDGLHFYISGANAPALTVTFTPEPSSLILCGLGAIGLFVAARRRKA